MIASVASVVVNIAVNVVLVRVMGYAGLALGTSHRRHGQRGHSGVPAASRTSAASRAGQLDNDVPARSLAAGLAMGAAAWYAQAVAVAICCPVRSIPLQALRVTGAIAIGAGGAAGCRLAASRS